MPLPFYDYLRSQPNLAEVYFKRAGSPNTHPYQSSCGITLEPSRYCLPESCYFSPLYEFLMSCAAFSICESFCALFCTDPKVHCMARKCNFLWDEWTGFSAFTCRSSLESPRSRELRVLLVDKLSQAWFCSNGMLEAHPWANLSKETPWP